jgi:hypothetical protein
MPRSGSEAVIEANDGSTHRTRKAEGAVAKAAPNAAPRKSRARGATAAPNAAPRKPRSRVAGGPQRIAPIQHAVNEVETSRAVVSPARLPEPHPQVRQTPPALVILAQLWVRVSAFVRGPGRLAALVALKTAGLLLAKTWSLLKTALRRSEPEPPLLPPRPAAETSDHSEPDSYQSHVQFGVPLGDRIPPHQRHIYARMNSC